jgi:hypothetical protein
MGVIRAVKAPRSLALCAAHGAWDWFMARSVFGNSHGVYHRGDSIPEKGWSNKGFVKNTLWAL